jgi:hypothetical protein
MKSRSIKEKSEMVEENRGVNMRVCVLGHLQVWIAGKWLRGLWAGHYKV